MQKKKLLPWSESIKKQVKRKVGEQIFSPKTSNDTLFDSTLTELPEEHIEEIVHKISSEFQQSFEVSLPNENIRGLAADTVGTALRTSPCKKLDLSSNYIRDQDVTAITKNLHHKDVHLEDLDLSNNRIGVDGAKFLGEVLEYNKTLTSLNLDTNAITGSGIEAIARSLVKNKTLQNLSANWNNIHVYAEEFYFTLVRNRTLVTLQLGYCNLNDEVAAALSEGLLANDTLLELFLFGNQISDQGADFFLSALTSNNSLRYLNLDSNLLSDSSGRRFIEVMKENSSRGREFVVNLFHNQLSHGVEDELKELRRKQRRKKTKFFSDRYVNYDSDRSSDPHVMSEFFSNRFFEMKTEEDSEVEENSERGEEATGLLLQSNIKNQPSEDVLDQDY